MRMNVHEVQRLQCVTIDTGVSTLFVTTASTETLNVTTLDVISLLGAKQRLHQKSYRLAKRTSLHNFITLTK